MFSANNMSYISILLPAVLFQNQKTIMPCVPTGLFILMNRLRTKMTEYVIDKVPRMVKF